MYYNILQYINNEYFIIYNNRLYFIKKKFIINRIYYNIMLLYDLYILLILEPSLKIKIILI